MYSKILIPIDLADESSWRVALPRAIELLRASSGALHVLTVVPEQPPQLPFLPNDYSDRMINYASEKLATFLEGNIPDDLSVGKSVRQGAIYREILQQAKEIGADLIVMASHRPELKDYLLGPNAARVVRHANCSVLVVR